MKEKWEKKSTVISRNQGNNCFAWNQAHIIKQRNICLLEKKERQNQSCLQRWQKVHFSSLSLFICFLDVMVFRWKMQNSHQRLKKTPKKYYKWCCTWLASSNMNGWLCSCVERLSDYKGANGCGSNHVEKRDQKSSGTDGYWTWELPCCTGHPEL